MDARQFDVAVVGASVAGCTAARLFAQSGAKVALIERRDDPAAYKVACTHAILSPAAPIIDRLGLTPLLLERGALRTAAEAWTPYSGWLRVPDDFALGWGVTRRTLDPLLRELAAGTAGVELFPGWTATRVLTDGARPAGGEGPDRGHPRPSVPPPLGVGAHGRGAALAPPPRGPGGVRAPKPLFFL